MQLKPPKDRRESSRKTERDMEFVFVERNASFCNPPPISTNEQRIPENKDKL